MKILILGAGQVGRTAADHLSREEANEVTVVDVNEDVLRELQDRLDVRTVAGNAAHPSVLEAAGTAEADIIVALTSSDEVNMMACEVAFTLFRTPTKIARIRAADYTERAALFGVDGLSVDVFINPEQLVTEYVERLIYHPGALQVLEFADGKVRLVGLRGDAADEELLIEENIDSADVFAALTNSEEANILSAMLAKRLGAHKVIALINKPSYTELVESSSIDIAISPQTITIGSLLAHVRRGDVVRVHSLRRGAAEALEAVVHGDEGSSRVVGKTVEQIELPEGTSIGAIVRGDDVLMAHHDTTIREDDHVI